jgi:hypothetical protein
MNFNKHTFKVEEFQALPIFPSAREAPVGEPFLLEGRMSAQKTYLTELLVDPGIDKLVQHIEEQNKKYPGKNNNLRVNFWTKYKDGNVRDNGGTILFEKQLNVVGDKLVIDTGPSAEFEHTHE